jgi:hypothetical protein
MHPPRFPTAHCPLSLRNSTGLGDQSADSISIQCTSHFPTHIHCCDTGTDEPGLDRGMRLVTVFENGREHRRVELINL